MIAKEMRNSRIDCDDIYDQLGQREVNKMLSGDQGVCMILEEWLSNTTFLKCLFSLIINSIIKA